MFKFLQRNTSLHFILLPIVVLLLWGDNLLHPHFIQHYYDVTPMILYKPLVLLQSWSALAGILVSLAFVILNVALLMKVNRSIRLIEKRSTLYIFLFVIFASSLQDFKQLNPMMPALTFIILGLTSLFEMYKQERELKTIFECGLFFSFATLFYAPTLYFSIIIFLGLSLLVPFYWRQWFSALVGYILPFFILFAIAFCFDAIQSQLDIWKINLLQVHKEPFNYLMPICFTGYLALLFVLSFCYAFFCQPMKVSRKKYYVIFLLFLLIILGLYLFVPYVNYCILFFGLLPASIFISNYMLGIRRTFIVEFFFLIIVAFAILIQIFPNKMI